MPKTKKTKVKTFDLLGSDDYADQVKETMLTLASKKKRISGVDLYSNASKEHVELTNNILFQEAIGMKGLPHGTLIELIGQDGIGKTSLVWTIAGYAMLQNSPFFLVESEAKPMDKNRVMRCLSDSRSTAKKMLDRVLISKCVSILDAVHEIENWVEVQREVQGVPMDIPLFCAIDTFSKLMAPKEAEGRNFYEGAKPAKSKTLEELGTGTNFEHAKYCQKWCRTLPSWLLKNNVILVIVSHQNQKVDMGFGGGSFSSDSYNRTKIGGNAFNQNAALQLILTREGYLTQSGEKIGTKVKATIAKNSYGPEGGTIRYELVSRPWLDDAEDYQQPALFFDNTTAEWFAANSILRTKVERKRYTCEDLGVIAKPAHDFCKALYDNPEFVSRLCSDRQILGYPTFDVSGEHDVDVVLDEEVEPTEDE